MRILLFGKQGQLGWELERSLACLGTIQALDYPEVDYSKPDTLPPFVHDFRPDLIINAVAYTDVDKAESEPELARMVNATAVGILAEQARRLNIPLIHYSTDYVFDGTKGTPYFETDAAHPINVYGQTKLEGEKALAQVGGAYLIFRTSWVYSLRKGGFVNKVLEWSRTQKVIRIVDDQIGSPTWARMLAEATSLLIAGSRDHLLSIFQTHSGIYHLAGDGYCSRYEWASEIIKIFAGAAGTVELVPAKSDEFPTPARRPGNASLNCDLFKTAFYIQLPDWKIALRMLK